MAMQSPRRFPMWTYCSLMRRTFRANVKRLLRGALAKAMADVPWSVKNQARMHRRNGDAPYADTTDALRFWLETPTAVAIRIADDGGALLLAPFGIEDLLGMVSRPTPRGREKLSQYRQRMREKNWPARWPRVRIVEGGLSGRPARPG